VLTTLSSNHKTVTNYSGYFRSTMRPGITTRRRRNRGRPKRWYIRRFDCRLQKGPRSISTSISFFAGLRFEAGPGGTSPHNFHSATACLDNLCHRGRTLSSARRDIYNSSICTAVKLAMEPKLVSLSKFKGRPRRRNCKISSQYFVCEATSKTKYSSGTVLLHQRQISTSNI